MTTPINTEQQKFFTNLNSMLEICVFSEGSINDADLLEIADKYKEQYQMIKTVTCIMESANLLQKYKKKQDNDHTTSPFQPTITISMQHQGDTNTISKSKMKYCRTKPRITTAKQYNILSREKSKDAAKNKYPN